MKASGAPPPVERGTGIFLLLDKVPLGDACQSHLHAQGRIYCFSCPLMYKDMCGERTPGDIGGKCPPTLCSDTSHHPGCAQGDPEREDRRTGIEALLHASTVT